MKMKIKIIYSVNIWVTPINIFYLNRDLPSLT